MTFLLRLKHWQLFATTWGLPLLINVFSFSNPSLLFSAFPFMMLCFTIGTFGWIWAIANTLNTKLPTEAKLNLRRFNVLFSIPLVYILLVLLSIFFSSRLADDQMDQINPGIIVSFIVPLHLLSMFMIFWGVRFAAKTLKSVELGRAVKFSDYVGEFFLIWLSFVGVWILQPRLNNLTKQ